ncbi:hypothetical protein D9756_010439 [Leucocoprinus leucothites]|uniref:NADP-dependent oxidoreductase domain-containing protein n=1 Tax=Leucocoprinus leucothites TaxID=201217 RepID=A0A8H5FRC1_9AGAR|nr:hypothetical protein D9756_010439 [Leucoagaricus leucothites]
MSIAAKKVPYVRLGNSGLKVSRIILGTMQYGDLRWQPWVIGDQQEANRHIKAAYDAGIQTFDTADVYSNGASEVILGNAIKDLKLPREEIVVMTKMFSPVMRDFTTNLMATGQNPDTAGYVNQHGLSRKHIFDAVKASLGRLQLDYVDVLQCHRFDKDTPISEIMQALHDVVQAGGFDILTNSSSPRDAELASYTFAYYTHSDPETDYAIANKLTPFISMQNHYNLIYREEEREMIPTLKHFGVGVIPWSPLARGLLTRPLTEKTTRGTTDWVINKYFNGPGTEEILKRVEEISKKRGISMAQVSVAWTLTKDPSAAPIVGTTSIKNLEDILGAINVTLTPEEMKYLEEPYRAQGIIGHF